MLTPRSSRTWPCCRPEANTRNDSRRLSAICEKSTFFQYLMEVMAPSGLFEDQRIMARRSSRLLGGLTTGHRARCLGSRRLYRSAPPGAARSVRWPVEGVFRLLRFARALVDGARGPEPGSLALVPSPFACGSREWPRSQESCQWQSSPSLAQGLESVWPSIVPCSGRLFGLRFLRELD
jgi:hypothetical protein